MTIELPHGPKKSSMALAVPIGWAVVLLALMLASAPPLDHFVNSPDMGYQLSLEHLARSGKFPFVDMFYHYGPLVAFTGAAGQWVHHGVIPEILICSFGYCLALTCILLVVVQGAAARPRWAIPIGLATSLGAWCALARFYKWYYWLLPMLMLVCLSRPGQEAGKGRRHRFLLGLIAGITTLYRHDLGLACLLTAMVAVAAEACRRQTIRKTAVDLTWVVVGFLVPLACWFAILAAVGGPISCRRYLSALLDGTIGTTRQFGIPLPRWDWRAITSDESCRFHLLVMDGLSCLTAVVLGGRSLLGKNKTRPPDAVPFLAAGTLGLALLPQALYRSDVQHILQVIPPLLIIAALLVARLIDGGHRSAASRIGSAALATIYLALLIFPLVCVRNSLRADLAPPGKDLLERYRALAAGLDRADLKNPVVQVAQAVRQHSRPGQPILVTSPTPQICFWADRPISGLLNVYAGTYSIEAWRRRNLAAIEREPPVLVVANRDFLAGSPDSLFQKHNPELYAWLKARYPHIILETGDFIILGRP